MAKFMAIPTPRTKNLSQISNEVTETAWNSDDAQTTANGGFVTITVYPRINKLSDIIRDFDRPILEESALMKKAAAMNPRALQIKMIDTVP